MGQKTNFRARVMKYAHQIFYATGLQWSKCLCRAWKVYHLAKKMRQGVVKFLFLKADGTVRKAYGTLCNLPAGITFGGKKLTKPSYKTFVYFDAEKQEFRSFKIENFICAI